MVLELVSMKLWTKSATFLNVLLFISCLNSLHVFFISSRFSLRLTKLYLFLANLYLFLAKFYTDEINLDELLDNIDNQDIIDILDQDISEEEILLAVKNLNNGKAPGEDDIINKYIKSTMNQFLPIHVNNIFIRTLLTKPIQNFPKCC
jgi:hypothetical protein